MTHTHDVSPGSIRMRFFKFVCKFICRLADYFYILYHGIKKHAIIYEILFRPTFHIHIHIVDSIQHVLYAKGISKIFSHR